MIFDRYTIAFGVLIGIFNGILFSYYAEAPTIFIERFHFNQSQYGFMGCAVAVSTILGAWLSNWRLKQNSPHKLIQEGILLALIGTLALSMVAIFPLTSQVVLYIIFISIILAGIGMALPNCLSLALVKFQEVAGTAGAFLSLGYYVIVSICTFFIGVLHSGSMLVFPAFCLVLLLIALFCIKIATRNTR